jgi:hypothetical protein
LNFEFFDPIVRQGRMLSWISKLKIENSKFGSLKTATQQSEPPTTDYVMPLPENE